MAAPLSFPDGCREKRGSELGQRNGKSPSANVCAFADGDFCVWLWIRYVKSLYMNRKREKVCGENFVLDRAK